LSDEKNSIDKPNVYASLMIMKSMEGRKPQKRYF